MLNFLLILLRLAFFGARLLLTEKFLPALGRRFDGGHTAKSPASEGGGDDTSSSSELGIDELLAWQLTDFQDHDAVINIVAHFDGVLELNQVQEQVEAFVVPHHRMHTVPVSKDSKLNINEPCSPLSWRKVRTPLDMSHHLQERTFETATQMEAYCQQKANSPSELRSSSHPWWDLHLLHVTQEQTAAAAEADDKKNKCHVLLRCHHALGDGVSLVQALGPALVDASGQPANLSSVFQPRRTGASNAEDDGELKTSSRVLRCPQSIVRGVKWICWTLPWLVVDVVRCIKAAFDTMTEPADTKTPFHDGSRSFPPTFNHTTALLPRYSVSHAKLLKQRLNQELAGGGREKNRSGDPYTLNDIQYSLFAGAIRRYNQHLTPREGESRREASSKRMRSFTPLALPHMNLPKIASPSFYRSVLRNYWILIKSKVPTHQPTALERVKAAHKEWTSIKHSMAVPVGFFLSRFNAENMTLRQLRDLNRKLGSEVTLMFSNVPGPMEPLFTRCGQGRLTGVHVIFPNFPSQVIIVSCDGYFNICATMQKMNTVRTPSTASGIGPNSREGDEEEEDEESLLSRCYVEELQELCLSVGLVDHGDEVLQHLKPKY